MNKEELDQIIEKSVGTEPGLKLSTDFAQKVTLQIVRREQWKTDLREYLSLTGVLLILLAMVSGFYYFVDKAFVLQSIAFLSQNIISVILVVLLLNFVWFADRVLLRLLFSRWSKT